jgi:hypothetical protein
MVGNGEGWFEGAAAQMRQRASMSELSALKDVFPGKE